ncbi:MAG: RNA polymerase sigma factor [Chloroflexi bacterium CFX4]|nr:RNA polymerase sigma factor [Chloroflexi bacterium CFX4]MDL1923963.1 RNA polymerase sigma factor [Chloroflexi bacterium CFX3]
MEGRAIGTLAYPTMSDAAHSTALDATAERAVMAAAQGDKRLFAPIYERYVARIYAYCLRRVDDPQEAEDLTSQVFTNALLALSQYRGGSVAAWLFRIAHNAVINHLKQRNHQARHAHSLDQSQFDPPSDAPEPAERLIAAEEAYAIQQLVAKLPAEQQNVVLMRVVGGLSAAEIGAALGKREGAIRTMLHRALRWLQNAYQAQEGEDRR